jgi:hypothetical protein
MNEIEALRERRLSLLGIIGKAADEISKIDKKLAEIR